MLESLNMLSTQVREIWRQFGVTQRFNVVFSLMVAIGTILGLVYWSARPDYRVLYSNLTLSDAAQMREKLEESKIDVKVGQSGMSIAVPASKLYSARLMLAQHGLPQDSSTGFELFEQPKFGLTDFAQKVNYQRALQGELERTISSMQGVRSARVMLVLPKEHLFATDEDRRAQASILLNMAGSVALNHAQVQSIVHIVASSVQSLDPSQVTVTDQSGNLLTRSHDVNTAMEHGSEQLDVQERTEQRLVDKAQSILDRALGVGNSIVRVNVALDFADIEQRREMYSAEGRLAVSERIVTADKTTGGKSGGRAGVVANVSVGNPADMTVNSSGGKDKSEEITTEYVVPSDVSMIRQKGVRIEKLTVAVCLAMGAEARSADEMKSISDVVSNALGVDVARSDTIHVTEMPFAAPQVPEDPAWWENLPISYDSIFKGMGGLVALCVVFGASRKVRATLVANNPSIEVPINEVHEQEQEKEREEELINNPPMELEDQLQFINQMAKNNPKTVAAWITSAAEWNG